MTSTTTYRSALGLAVGTALSLLWSMGAVGIVGIEGDRADLLFLGVLAVGIGGAIVARLRPDAMARAMLVTAGATVLVGLIALALGKHEAAYSSMLEILGLTGMFAAMFGASAVLFRRASAMRAPSEPPAGH